MGVPSFFKYLVRKYPSILEYFYVSAHVNATIPGLPTTPPEYDSPDATITVSTTSVDNLYFDMNGIIHNSIHGGGHGDESMDDKIASTMCKKLDEIITLVKPKRLIYFALDGVAPRAKMNQQRSRRYIHSKEKKTWTKQLETELSNKILTDAPREEIEKLQNKLAKGFWDSNQISPGTSFMQKVSEVLHKYVGDRIASDPLWKDLVAIVSDSSVPGEGEHKIMDFIRTQRQQPGYDTNTHHCFFGNDADLLFLGLTVHENRFTILRQDNSAWKNKPSMNAATNTILVVRLPPAIQEQYLKQIFDVFGPVSRVVMTRDANNNVKGSAIIQFEDVESASKAVRAVIRINKSTRLFQKFVPPEDLDRHILRNEALLNLRDTVYVKNLPFETTETELGELFTTLVHRPKVVRIITTGKGVSRGYGYIQFSTEEHATKALTICNGPEPIMISGRPLQVEVCLRRHSLSLENLQKDKVIEEFLTVVDRYENTLAYKYLEAYGYDLDKALEAYNAGIAPEMLNLSKTADELTDIRSIFEPAFDGLMPITEDSQSISIPSTPTTPTTPGTAKGVAATPTEDQVASDLNVEDEEEEEVHRPAEDTLVYVHMHVLREYIKLELEHALATLNKNKKTVSFDLERAIDDYVFMCILCGNDFLPNIPSLDVRRGAVDILLEIYKSKCLQNGYYLVEDGKIRFDRLISFIDELSKVDSSFLMRKALDEAKQRRSGSSEATAPRSPNTSDPYAPIVPTVDVARWKQLYYEQKFKVPNITPTFINKVASKYTEGLVWVHKYYYYGIERSSWRWFYPFHFAPLAVDLLSYISSLKEYPSFEVGTPFKPYQQLLAILPPESSHCMPPAYAELMTSPNSPIKDFYPTDFEIFNEPGRPDWLGVALLDFIDEDRLLKAALPLEVTLTSEEIQRNTFGTNTVIAPYDLDPEKYPFVGTLGSVDKPINIDPKLRVLSYKDPTVSNFRIGRLHPIDASYEIGLAQSEAWKSISRPSRLATLVKPLLSSQALQNPAPSSTIDMLSDVIDMEASECLNNAQNHTLADCLAEDPEKYLESDADEQLLISIVFKVPVNLNFIQFKQVSPETYPKKTLLYTNRGNMTFDDVESVPCTLEIPQINLDEIIKLPPLKFQNVSRLVIFIATNCGAPTTKIRQLLLSGKSHHGADVSQLRKKEKK